MNKTVSSVMDLSEPWDNPHGGQVWYVTAFTTDGEVLSAGRKDEDAATELQGLLIEAIGTELDFILEPDKPTKSGKTKWKILGFGTPGGAATYTAPGVQGGAVAATGMPVSRQRSPEQNDDIRRAVALKAAASCVVGTSPEDVLKFADVFEAWLARTSEPALSAYEGGDSASTVVSQAGADSEDLPQETRPLPADGAGEVGEADVAQALGEGTPASDPHIHDYQLRQGVKGFLVCECGKTRKKETAPTT